jgi:hypothetical protein
MRVEIVIARKSEIVIDTEVPEGMTLSQFKKHVKANLDDFVLEGYLDWAVDKIKTFKEI